MEERIARILFNSMVIIHHDSGNVFERSFREQQPKETPLDNEFKETLEPTNIDENEIKDNISCAICQESFKEGDKVIKLPCEGKPHYFHIGDNKEECEGILPWFEKNNTCPICRKEFPKAPDDPSTDNESTDNQPEQPNIIISHPWHGLLEIINQTNNNNNDDEQTNNNNNNDEQTNNDEPFINRCPANEILRIINNLQMINNEQQEESDLQEAIMRSILE